MKCLTRRFYFSVLATLCITSVNALASELITEREVVIDDRYGGQHQIKQKVYDDGDGYYTFVRGGRSDELVEIHKSICESSGAEDAFDEGTIMISEDVIDAVVCKITEPEIMERIKRENINNTRSIEKHVEQDLEGTTKPNTFNLPSSLSLTPPFVNVRVNNNYYLNGYVDFYTSRGGFYSSRMWLDNRCSIAKSATARSSARYSYQLSVLCRSTNVGTQLVYLTASTPEHTGSAIGQVTVRR